MKELLFTTYREFSRDGGSRLAAALAYYALFAIAPALVVAVALAGALVGQAAVSAVAQESLASLLGQDLADVLVDMARTRSASVYYDTAWIAVGVLFVTSALALNQLQASFNRMWLLDLRPGVPVWHLVRVRLMQAVIALLPAALLVLGTIASSVTAAAAERPYLGRLAGLAEAAGSPLVMLASSAVAFFIVFMYLPDAHVPWRPALASAAVTAIAWYLGTYLLGLYVGRTATASVYGAAGAVFVLLIWLNYSSRVVLLGCKVTKVLTARTSTGVDPRPLAAVVVYQTLRESDDGDPKPPVV